MQTNFVRFCILLVTAAYAAAQQIPSLVIAITECAQKNGTHVAVSGTVQKTVSVVTQPQVFSPALQAQTTSHCIINVMDGAGYQLVPGSVFITGTPQVTEAISPIQFPGTVIWAMIFRRPDLKAVSPNEKK